MQKPQGWIEGGGYVDSPDKVGREASCQTPLGLFRLQMGVAGLSRSIAYTLADWGIRCNIIQPGFIETDMTQGMLNNPLVKKMTKKTFNNTILLRRAGKTEEIAYTVLFLASDESSYNTGTDIVVDGGWASVAAYLGNERQNNMLEMVREKRRGGKLAEKISVGYCYVEWLSCYKYG